MSSPEITKGNFLTFACERIGLTRGDKLRNVYFEAFKLSMCLDETTLKSNIDFENPSSILGPRSIANVCGKRSEELYNLNIFLDRPQAVEFLLFYGYPDTLTVTGFSKLSSSSVYYTLFNREISSVKGNNRIYTYAEILRIMNHEIVLDLPASCTSLLTNSTS